MNQNWRVALVQDALPFMGGAERVLVQALEVFPQADVFALIHNPAAFSNTSLAGRRVQTSFINRLPGAARHYRRYLPLLPLAIEQLDLRDYDIVISFSYAVAHGILTRPDQLHISYVHTPLRHAWHQYQDFLDLKHLRGGPAAWAAWIVLHYLRQWDFAAAARVDHFVAPSQWSARGLWHTYRRQAEVLYPPVAVQQFRPAAMRDHYFLVVSRLEAHKRVDLIIEAFNRLGLPLVVVGAGQEYRRLKRLAAGNVRLLGGQPDSVVQALLSRARGFVQAAEEDFGIAAVEAQAAGCPVIAYGRGGASETVIPGHTGILFDQQTSAGLEDGVRRFLAVAGSFEPGELIRNAQRFDQATFKNGLAQLVEREYNRFHWSAATIPYLEVLDENHPLPPD